MISTVSSVPVSVNASAVAPLVSDGSSDEPLKVITLPPDSVSPPRRETEAVAAASRDHTGRNLAIAALVLLGLGAAATVAIVVRRAKAHAAESPGGQGAETMHAMPDVPLPPTYVMPH